MDKLSRRKFSKKWMDRGQATRLPVIPLEIWERAVLFLDRGSLASLSLTCRTFRDIAQPMLAHRFLAFPMGLRSSLLYTLEDRLAFFRKSVIASRIKECFIVPPDVDDDVGGSREALEETKRHIRVLTSKSLNILSFFPNLTTLHLQYVHFTPERTRALLSLQKCLDQLTFDRCWTDGVAFRMAVGETLGSGLSAKRLTLNDRSPENLSHSLSIQFIKSSAHTLTDLSLNSISHTPPGQSRPKVPATILDALSRYSVDSPLTFPLLTTLELPLGWMSLAEVTTFLVQSCQSLQNLIIASPQNGDVQAGTVKSIRAPPLNTTPFQDHHQSQLMLPNLTKYRGPTRYLHSFLSERNKRLETIDITVPCQPEEFEEMLHSFRPSPSNPAGSNVITLAVRLKVLTTGLLDKMFKTFPHLANLSIKEPVLEPLDWFALLGPPKLPPSPADLPTPFQSQTELPIAPREKTHLASLKFGSLSRGTSSRKFLPTPRQIIPTLSLFSRIYPSLMKQHPYMAKITIVYSVDGTALVWTPKPSLLRVDTGINPGDVMVDVDSRIIGGRGGRVLNQEEYKKLAGKNAPRVHVPPSASTPTIVSGLVKGRGKEEQGWTSRRILVKAVAAGNAASPVQDQRRLSYARSESRASDTTSGHKSNGTTAASKTSSGNPKSPWTVISILNAT